MTSKDQQTKDMVIEALKEVFDTTDSKTPAEMKVLVRRIPILCTSVEDIHRNIESIHNSLSELIAWKKDDSNWKKEFDVWKTTIVEPLIQKESDSKAVNHFVLKTFKYAGAIVGFMGSVALLYGYLTGHIH